MTDSAPDSTGDRPVSAVGDGGDRDDGEYRQHTSADVAPELFGNAPEER